jgi:outer membrane protein, heavy metal efflux system
LPRAAIVGFAFMLASCSTYEPLELAHQSNLAPSLARLNLAVPSAEPGKPPVTLDPAKPLTPNQVGLVAVLNSPDLADARAKIESAHADLQAARILPNPSIGLGYAFLISGPATSDAWSASISQDIQSIITYGARVDAAKARYKQVGAAALWDEWQTAQKARLLAIDINADAREIRLREQELALITDELKQVRAATEAGNLDLTAEAPLRAAQAGAEHDLTTARLTLLKDWQDLDATLGLRPNARFEIAEPEPVTLPQEIDSLITSLPGRRPDLVALRLGYDAAEQDVRAAILGQFPAFTLGGAGGSDTSNVLSFGPAITFDLPIFNRGQAKVASSRATRLQLHAEYQARLDDADGTARGLLARSRVVATNLERSRAAADSAASILKSAQQAYRQGNLSQRDLTDFQTTALDRQLDVLGYERTLQENALALSVELGVGLPQTMLNSPVKESRQ